MEVTQIIKNSFEKLKNIRFFVSEADFQCSLGLELSKSFKNDKNTKVILEFPINQNGRIIYIDIMIVKDKSFYPIELKYKTKKIDSDKPYENTNLPIKDILKNQGAQDLGGYGLWRDINRIETLIKKSQAKSGVCIFITNDEYYWKGKCSPNSQGYSFQTIEGEKKKGQYQWNIAEKNENKNKSCIYEYPEFYIENNYQFNFENFYKMQEKNGDFKSLFIEIV